MWSIGHFHRFLRIRKWRFPKIRKSQLRHHWLPEVRCLDKGKGRQKTFKTFLFKVVFPFFANALWVKLVEIPRWIKVSCPLTSACVNDQFLPRIGFHRAIYDHCLPSRRHLAYCHFFASIVVVTYLALSRCQGRSSRHTSAIIKPLDKQTIKDFYTFMAIISL